MTDLRDYIPQDVEFELPKKNPYPTVLFEGADSLEEIERVLADKFTVLNANISTTRKLDAYEKRTIRENYSELIENDKIECEQSLAKIEAEAKNAVKDAKERLQSVNTQISDLVQQVKGGVKSIELPDSTTYRIAIDNHYLYYTWLNGKFILAKTELIPEWDRRELFNMQERNQRAFQDVFGIDLQPEEVAEGQEPEQESIYREAEELANEIE